MFCFAFSVSLCPPWLVFKASGQMGAPYSIKPGIRHHCLISTKPKQMSMVSVPNFPYCLSINSGKYLILITGREVPQRHHKTRQLLPHENGASVGVEPQHAKSHQQVRTSVGNRAQRIGRVRLGC